MYRRTFFFCHIVYGVVDGEYVVAKIPIEAAFLGLRSTKIDEPD